MRNVAIGKEVLFFLNQLLIANRVIAPKNPPVATNKASIISDHRKMFLSKKSPSV